MFKAKIPTGTGYFDLDLVLPFYDFDIHILGFLNERLYNSVKVTKEDFMHLLYFVEGNVNISFDNKDYFIEPNSFVLFPYGFEHVETIMSNPCIKYHISYIVEIFKRKYHVKRLNSFRNESDLIKKMLINKKQFEIIKDTSDNTNYLFEKIVKELDSDLLFPSYSFFSMFSNILINCVRSHHVNKTRPNQNNYITEYQISSRIVSHLEFFFKTATLEDMSEQLHISVRQLQRHIKKIFGVSFTEKVNMIKIKNAKDLLMGTNQSVSSIANEVGFKQTSSFNRVFKLYEKTTPLRYRISKRSEFE